MHFSHISAFIKYDNVYFVKYHNVPRHDVGNSMSILVSTRRKFRNQSTFRWLGALATVELVLNFVDPLWITLNNMIKDFEADKITPFLCKMRYYVRTSCSQVR